MKFLMAFVQIFCGCAISAVAQFSISMVGCCVFCGLPIARMLLPHKDCVDARKMIRMYHFAVLLHAAIVCVECWAVYRFATEMVQLGFLIASAVATLATCWKWGYNKTNVVETIEKAQTYVVKGKEEEADRAIEEVMFRIDTHQVESRAKVWGRGVLATVIFWVLSRGVPSCMSVAFPENAVAFSIAFLPFLAIGWYVAGAATKWKAVKAIQANLYVMAVIETLGFLNAIVVYLSSLGNYVGSTSDLYALAIIASGLYVFLCCVLAVKTEQMGGRERMKKQAAAPDPVKQEQQTDRKEKRHVNGNAMNAVAWMVAGVMLTVAVMIFGSLAYTSWQKNAEAEREAIRQEAYDSGYDAGYDAGQTDAKYANSPNGYTVRMVARITEVSEGMTPLEAAEIVKRYIESDWSNKPSLEEYQNAIGALVKAGELIGY